MKKAMWSVAMVLMPIVASAQVKYHESKDPISGEVTHVASTAIQAGGAERVLLWQCETMRVVDPKNPDSAVAGQ
jgi:hypothetical protein